MGWIASVGIQNQHATLMDAAMRVWDAPTVGAEANPPIPRIPFVILQTADVPAMRATARRGTPLRRTRHAVRTRRWASERSLLRVIFPPIRVPSVEKGKDDTAVELNHYRPA